jgi:maleylacetoacetate isomerase
MPMIEAVLHGYHRSSAAFRVRIALNLKHIGYENRSYNLRRGEQRATSYLKLNPQGLVPALEIDDLFLTQSLAIIDYLDNTRGEPSLHPTRAKDRAHVDALAQLIACDIHPIDNLRVLQFLRTEFKHPEEDIRHWYLHWIKTGFEAFESRIAPMYQPGDFCCGRQPTVADVCLIPQVVNALNYSLDLEPYPTIRAVFRTAMESTAFTQALPEGQPDARS